MGQLLAAMKYWALFMAVVEMIEQAVPPDTPGTAKLHMAIDAIQKMNEELKEFTEVLPQMFAFAKAIYTGLRALGK